MAVAFDAASSLYTGFASSATFAHTVSGADRLLNVWVSVRQETTAVSTVTYAGTSLTFVGARQGVGAHIELWRLIAPATGANNIIVTMAADATFVSGGVSFTGVHQTTPLGTLALADGESTAPTVDVTSAVDDLVNDGLAARNQPTLTVGPDQTERYNTVGESQGGSSSTEPGAATVTMSWTLSVTQFWAIGGVSVKPAAAATERHQTRRALTPPVGMH